MLLVCVSDIQEMDYLLLYPEMHSKIFQNKGAYTNNVRDKGIGSTFIQIQNISQAEQFRS